MSPATTIQPRHSDGRFAAKYHGAGADLAGPPAPTVVRGRDLPDLAFCSNKPLDLDVVTPVTNYFDTKPSGGLWLSPVGPDGRTAWQQFCAREQMRPRDTHVQSVRFDPAARVLKIDTADDFEAVRAEYATADVIDFEAVSQDYDALWLTRRGEAVNHMDLYGWDVETVLVFNPRAVWQ